MTGWSVDTRHATCQLVSVRSRTCNRSITLFSRATNVMQYRQSALQHEAMSSSNKYFAQTLRTEQMDGDEDDNNTILKDGFRFETPPNF